MERTPIVDPIIRHGQYRHPANLEARIDLHRRFSTNSQGWFAWLGEQVGLDSSIDVLELGGGEGGFWAANAANIPHSATLTLTDFSPGRLEATATRLRPLLPDARFAVVDAQAIPFLDARFDTVIANHMLYHVPDLHRRMREIRRVLRPDGRFFAATNGEHHMAELAELMHATGTDAASFTIDDAFSLEHGAAALNRHFARVERRDYVDALAVTDPEAIVRYVRSAIGADTMREDQLDQMRSIVNSRIANDGAFRITKSTGLFIGSGMLHSIYSGLHEG